VVAGTAYTCVHVVALGACAPNLPVAIIISPFYLFIVDKSLTLKGFQ
jgi:hypothetical protein